MLKRLIKIFGSVPGEDVEVEAKDQMHDILIATCALFLELANIDGEFDDIERESILRMLKAEYNLSEEYAAELTDVAKEELQGKIDLWQFTNRINRNYSDGEKIRIVELLWKIVYSDGKLDEHEDYLVHKLARLLRLNHRQLIDAKQKIIHDGSS
ncbi:MAG: hypothetical protein GTO51_02465 [Candidatus Latescibacteria bacterium]|nr:hypothetical protein [Candidatus Latescibacterota bacterium]NIM22524.1 hypothetical protein [Candidatus Latescibacterota bacterium]NIM64838.1 hypothetical protein [Candidatus Latescibacterota bacterium]NIO01346.1 hypothetical protein [Candidatus Latescibacterota bacterium]NIO27835.1 hypothetical protein [Candidatus Latescibacterota bacterium]